MTKVFWAIPVDAHSEADSVRVVLEADYDAALADGDLRYANGRRNERLINQDRIRALEAALRDTLSGNYPTPARYDEIRALVATAETKGEPNEG